MVTNIEDLEMRIEEGTEASETLKAEIVETQMQLIRSGEEQMQQNKEVTSRQLSQP